MATPDLTGRPPKHPKRVPWTLMAALWACAVVQIFAEFFTAPHSIQTMRLMSSLTFVFVGSGCAALCAWLIQRSTVDPYEDYLAMLDLLHKAGYEQGHCAGHDEGYREGRASSLGIIRPHFNTAQDTEDADGEPPADQTGTEGSAPR